MNGNDHSKEKLKKGIVNYLKDFLWYSTTMETYCASTTRLVKELRSSMGEINSSSDFFSLSKDRHYYPLFKKLSSFKHLNAKAESKGL